MARILVVDDEGPARELLQHILQLEAHEVVTAHSAEAALDLMGQARFDVIVTDNIMPGMSGVELARRVSEMEAPPRVLLITAEPSLSSATASLRAGVFEYMSKPLRAAPLLRAVERAVEFERLAAENRAYQKHLERLVAERTAELEAMVEGTIRAMSRALESRDPYTAGHQRRVALLGRAIAWEMGLSDVVARAVYLAGLLHDLGKISVPSDLLTRPGKLQSYEFVLIKQHPRVGHDILAQVPFRMPLAEIVLQHHERLDGGGYPQGLRKADILPEARILAVADVVEAISNHRPYRPARGIDRAMNIIHEHGENGLDPDVVRACVRLFMDRGYALE